ncbi:chloride channel protein [Marinobacter changyiensis]|uniref:chloride channel protein n=1 Tax=Marinobacter changyiensis TaxID=2604091 RepID=UPI003CCD38C4
MVSLGSGASVGQYGPLVYLGAMFGNPACHLRLNLRHQRSIAIACGVAAAIANASPHANGSGTHRKCRYPGPPLVLSNGPVA